MSVTKSKSSTALFLESLNDNPRDNHCFRENPGHYNHEEPKVKWAYIHRASKIFWFLLSLWDSFWRLFWGVNVYLHFTKIKIKYVYFSMDTYTCRHIHTLRYFFPQISGSKNLYMNQHHVQGLLKQEFLGLSPWVSLPVGLGCVRPCVCVCVCVCTCARTRSVLSDSMTLCTGARQAPLPMEFSRQKTLQCVATSSSRGSSQPSDQKTNLLCLLLWQANSLLLCHLGSP